VGVTESAWNNPGKGKELAVAQISKGADVIFAAAGNSGLGVFDAAEQYDKYVIGVDSNQNWVKPGHVLTSMVKRVDNAVYQIVGDLVNHRFKGGIHVYGLENDGVGFAMDQFNSKLISPDVVRQVDAAREKIIRGEIKVTDAMAK
jgi:basic membrane protein A